MNAEQDRLIKVGLVIEDDNTVPVPLVQVALDTLTPQDPGVDYIKVVATNWEASDDGARAIAAFLKVAAQAIEEELGVKAAPKRPRFNPQPRGAGGK